MALYDINRDFEVVHFRGVFGQRESTIKVHIRELPFFAQKLAALRGVERYMAELKRINMS